MLKDENVQYEQRESESQEQPWLNKDREEAYKVLSEGLPKQDETTVHKWLSDLANHNKADKNAPEFTYEDFNSAAVINVLSEGASKIAGREIVRPVIIFSDFDQFNRFASVWGGNKEGFVMEGSNFKEGDIFKKTGLIFTNRKLEAIGHEIIHTIDPYIEDRKSFHSSIGELAAQIHGLRGDTGKIDNSDWELFVTIMGGYYEQYAKDTNVGEILLSKDEYTDVLKKMTEKLKLYYNESGYVELQRKLLQYKTIREIVI